MLNQRGAKASVWRRRDLLLAVRPSFLQGESGRECLSFPFSCWEEVLALGNRVLISLVSLFLLLLLVAVEAFLLQIVWVTGGVSSWGAEQGRLRGLRKRLRQEEEEWPGERPREEKIGKVEEEKKERGRKKRRGRRRRNGPVGPKQQQSDTSSPSNTRPNTRSPTLVTASPASESITSLRVHESLLTMAPNSQS